MAVDRVRPVKQYRAVVAFGPYSKGALLQPTGIYRETLVKRGFIEEVQDEPLPEVPAELDNDIQITAPRGGRVGRRER